MLEHGVELVNPALADMLCIQGGIAAVVIAVTVALIGEILGGNNMKITDRYTQEGCADLIRKLSDGDLETKMRGAFKQIPKLSEMLGGKTLRDTITVAEAEALCEKAGELLA